MFKKQPVWLMPHRVGHFPPISHQYATTTIILPIERMSVMIPNGRDGIPDTRASFVAPCRLAAEAIACEARDRQNAWLEHGAFSGGADNRCLVTPSTP